MRARGTGLEAGAVLLLVAACLAVYAEAETCTTQSAMTAADRDALAGAAREVAAKIQAGDAAGLQAATIPEFATKFDAIRSAIVETSGHLKGDTLRLEQIYLLDATGLAAGSEAQFFCTLNRSQAEVDFAINGLAAGTYGFAIVTGTGSSPWRVSMLLRRDSGRWLLAGFYPAATEAAGHDGLWYWREARRLSGQKQAWNAWLYFSVAETLERPAPFVQSSHLERLLTEQKAGAPPALSNGISATTPLVVRGPDGKEYRFTGLGVEALSGRPKADVIAHLQTAATDTAALRVESDGGAQALVSAYPEVKGAFAGVLMSLEPASDAPARPPLVTEHPMTGLR